VGRPSIRREKTYQFKFESEDTEHKGARGRSDRTEEQYTVRCQEKSAVSKKKDPSWEIKDTSA